jgi:hypothetical protein
MPFKGNELVQSPSFIVEFCGRDADAFVREVEVRLRRMLANTR